jgi:sporulation protein YlmC with PRC-barrel domain
MIELFRDVLDKQLVDMTGVKMGKVDGLIMTVAPDRRPRITAIELGSVTLARRLGPRAARLIARLAMAISGKRDQPYHIPWDRILEIGVDIDVAVELKSTPLDAWRERLRRHIVRRIPGS